MNNLILDVLKDVQLFKAQAHIPPGLRKKYRRAASFCCFLVRRFVALSFRRFVVRCVVVLSFYRWVAPPVDEEI